MALYPGARITTLVQRALLGTPYADGAATDVAIRGLSYGELGVQPIVRKAHLLADEGSYFMCNNAQSGIAPSYGTSFSATAPYLLIVNQNTVNLRLYLDYVALQAVAAVGQTSGSTTAYTAAAFYIDSVNRYSSGGTNLTNNIVNVNYVNGATANGVSIYAGAITATSASANVRPLVGLRTVRQAVGASALNIIGEQYYFNHGGVEQTATGNITLANANIIPMPMPPIVIGAGQSALLYLWYQGATTPATGTYAPEIGFWMR